MPPSAITGTSAAPAGSTASRMAVSCGTPTPATIRVVQIEPGPMPTLIASAPASISALAPSRVATLPAMTCTALDSLLARVTVSSTRTEWPRAVSTTMMSQPASIRRSARSKPPSPVVVAAGTRRRPWSSLAGAGGAQPSLFVLGGVRMGDLLLNVLHGDEADAAVALVHHKQLLDAILVKEA